MRYKVRLNINGPVILSALSHFTPGDSLLAYSHVKATKPENIQAAIGDLPLVKETIGDDFFYKISIPHLVGCHPMSEINVMKSTSYGRMHEIAPGQIDLLAAGTEKNRGPYKRCLISLTPIWCEAVEYVFESDDVDRVMELFSGLLYFGKKSSIGYGRIRRIEGPFETDEPITRPLPADRFEVDGPIFPQRLKPAYFCADERHVAGIGKI